MRILTSALLLSFCAVAAAQVVRTTHYEDVGVVSGAQIFCYFLDAERTWGIRYAYQVDHFEDVLEKLNKTLDTHNKYLNVEDYWRGMQRKDAKHDENFEKFHLLMIELFKDAGLDMAKNVQIEKGHTQIQNIFIKSGDVLARPVFNTKLNRLDLMLMRRFTDLQEQMQQSVEVGKTKLELTDEQYLKIHMIEKSVLIKSNFRTFIVIPSDGREIAIETIERTAKIPRDECK